MFLAYDIARDLDLITSLKYTRTLILGFLF
jgi:hypothetical protein